MKLDVAVIADLCIDVLVKGDVAPVYGQVEQFVDDYHLEVGGSAAIFASQFTRLGGHVGLYGLVGDDVLGQYVRDRLGALGIPTDYLFSTQQSKTPLGLGLVRNDDRAMLTYEGCMREIAFESVSESGLLARAGHLHIASYFLLEKLQAQWPAVLSKLRRSGVTISLDTNWSPNGNWASVHEILPYIDVFLPNEAEALQISGTTQLEEAADWFGRYAGLTVIKRGAQGAMVIDRRTIRRYAIPLTALENLLIVDTTGAGDNFDAGFLFAWLKRSSLASCVRLAMACGTSSLARVGGIDGQLSRSAAESIDLEMH